jgi:hypothetical protein
MFTGILIFSLFLLTAFFIYKLLGPGQTSENKKKGNYSAAPVSPKLQPVLVPDVWSRITAVNNANISIDDVWWKALGNLDQLHQALMLAQKALPVWETYVASHDMLYKNSPTSTSSKIDHQLLAKAIDELVFQSRQLFPGSSKSKIKQYYYCFVGPVIALQDGNWAPPYPVKKMFLSVYNILKSIQEQDNIAAIENFLAIAINQSLDCIDITKLYSKPEITGFLQVYKNKL